MLAGNDDRSPPLCLRASERFYFSISIYQKLKRKTRPPPPHQPASLSWWSRADIFPPGLRPCVYPTAEEYVCYAELLLASLLGTTLGWEINPYLGCSVAAPSTSRALIFCPASGWFMSLSNTAWTAIFTIKYTIYATFSGAYFSRRAWNRLPAALEPPQLDAATSA